MDLKHFDPEFVREPVPRTLYPVPKSYSLSVFSLPFLLSVNVPCFQISQNASISLESVGKSQNSNICCSVGDPDDAFLGFTYVPPSEDLVE
jgi:hypothetical protein